MHKTKGMAFRLLLMTMAVCLGLAGCTGNNTAKSAEKPETENKAQTEQVNSWLEASELDNTETTEELYEKAKEEGKVVVYSQSSRIKDVKASFEKEYPGIEVEAYDMSSNEMVEKIVREQDAGLNNVDVVFIKDTGGVVSGELVKDGRLFKYAPDDIEAQLGEQFLDGPGLPFYFSTRVVFYNTEEYDEAPINNWWDLADEKWNGKVVIDDPLLSADTLDLFATMVEHSDDMAAAYKAKYGKDIELDGTENAGYEYIKRLLANDPIFVKSSGDVVKAVGTPGQTNPPIGISTSSKSRKIKSDGLTMNFVYDMEPKMSVPATSYLYVADQSKNINTAKLLIRWMAGETNGHTDGFSPYNVLGSWSTRTDINQDAQRSIKELNLWAYDAEFLYKNTQKVKDFIISNQ